MTTGRKRGPDRNAELDTKRTKNLDHGRCELLETGNFSDFIIASQGYEFRVHRACLLGASPYFDGVIDSGLSVSSRRPQYVKRIKDLQEVQESFEQRLTLDQEKPCAIFLILWYIYTKTYPAMKHSRLEWGDDREAAFLKAAPPSMAEFKSHVLLPHLEVYKLSDMMMLPNLKQTAYDEIRDQMLEFGDGDVGTIREGLVKDEETGIMSWAQKEDFQEAVRMVYSSPETNLSELQEFFAWGSVYNENKHGSRQHLGHIVKDGIHDFGWDLYVERDSYGAQNFWACNHCAGLSQAPPKLIVLENEHDFSILHCQCWYRGFCSKSCKSSSEDFQQRVRVKVYCLKCSTGPKKIWNLDYVKRSKDGLEIVTDGSTCRIIAKNVYHKMPRQQDI